MWNGFKSEEFDFQGFAAIIVYPDCEPIGRMVLKTEYMGAFPGFDIAMLNRGYYIIHVNHICRWAIDEDLRVMAEFVKFCAKKLGTEEKCIPEGMSAGGMQALRFAQEYPELVAVMYVDAPAVNMLSQCGLGRNTVTKEKTTREMYEFYNLDAESLVAFRRSPIDFMDKLTDNDIPIVLVYGDADEAVIWEESGKWLVEHYKAKGGNMKTILKPGCGHHPHGLEDPTPIIEFIEENYR